MATLNFLGMLPECITAFCKLPLELLLQNTTCENDRLFQWKIHIQISQLSTSTLFAPPLLGSGNTLF